ncbi:hypothetical protein MSAN_01147300 [Mycena sanguinolenta]|uniref:Uncharacterized protein n=1 Tax=Mycena sanguinolenta TaxID=230812 RepID=A0A8H6YHB5_9AGAR|nr:hypothetical protein MSAN_01147300 [Mycena sanguinolenta]
MDADHDRKRHTRCSSPRTSRRPSLLSSATARPNFGGSMMTFGKRLPVSAVVSSFWFIHFDVVDEDVQFYANLIFLNELKVIAASSRGPYSVKPMCQYIKFVVLRLFIDPDNNSTANPMDTISSQASTLLIPLQGRCLKY